MVSLSLFILEPHRLEIYVTRSFFQRFFGCQSTKYEAPGVEPIGTRTVQYCYKEWRVIQTDWITNIRECGRCRNTNRLTLYDDTLLPNTQIQIPDSWCKSVACDRPWNRISWCSGGREGHGVNRWLSFCSVADDGGATKRKIQTH